VNRYLESSDILTLTKDNIELTTKRITIRTHNKNLKVVCSDKGVEECRLLLEDNFGQLSSTISYAHIPKDHTVSLNEGRICILYDKAESWMIGKIGVVIAFYNNDIIFFNNMICTVVRVLTEDE
jgi:hypothetical protein